MDGRRMPAYTISSPELRATENQFFAGPDRFLVCKTDSVCIKRIFFGPKKLDWFWFNFAMLNRYLAC